MVRKYLICLLAALVLVCASPTRQASGEGDGLLLGLIPEDNIFKQMKRHRPLAQYLTKKLGRKVRFTVLSRYPHIITRFKTRGLDGAFFGIFTAVLAEEALSIEPIARSVDLSGKETSSSYIFVRADSGINDIRQLRGKRAAYVDQVTATGYLYMLYSLRQKGIKDPSSFFSRHTLTGSHESAVYSVHSRQAEVGLAKNRIVDAMLGRDQLIKDELKIIDVSPEMPDNTLYLRKDLPLKLKLEVQQVLMEMDKDPEGKKVLENYRASGFVAARSSDLAPIREMARKSGVDIKNFKYDYE